MVLWIRQSSPGKLIESLSSELRLLRPGPLTQAFATGNLSSLPRRGLGEPKLNVEQNLAAAACCTPGLHAVWGPPGTGKTGVIAHALLALRAMGKTVLPVGIKQPRQQFAYAAADAVLVEIELRRRGPGGCGWRF
jgi:hypothetical protein